MKVGELRELLDEVPDYYDVRLNGTVGVEGLERYATDDGPYVVVV